MNLLRSLATLALLLCVAVIGKQHGFLPAAVLLFAGGFALTPWSAMSSQLCVTLTPTQLLMLNIESFRKRCIPLSMFGTDFSATSVRYLQQAIARIRSLPTASTYVAGSGGYANGATSARSLLTDVPITLDQWGTVPLKLEHVNHVADSINDYSGSVGDAGFVLGKQVVDHVLAKANFVHFSQSTTIAAADSDVDMLNTVTAAMNGKTQAGERFMLVNSEVATALAGDQRLINSQWFGTAQGGETIRGWNNVFGFAQIREYADLPSGTDSTTLTITGEADTEVITTSAAHGYSVGQRVQVASLTGGSGISAGYFFVKTAPTTTTLTLSATLGGATSAFSTDISDGTIKKATNLSAIAFERRAFAVAGGAPPSVTAELAAQFGIPVNTLIEAIFDAETQVAMGMAKWQDAGTADLYIAPTMIYGARAGREIAAGAGTTCDYAAHLVITA